MVGDLSFVSRCMSDIFHDRVAASSIWFVLGPRSVFSFCAMPRRPFGACLEKALKEGEDTHRDLDVVELWSGAASIAKAAIAHNFGAAAVDVKDGQDLTSE